MSAKTLTPAQLREVRRATLHADGLLRLARGLDLLARGENLPNDPRELDRPRRKATKATKACGGGPA